MIPFSAALAGAFWERLLVQRLEQRRVAGREPPLEQRSEGQPGYLGESLVHLHLHRAPISATQPTATPAYGSPAYGYSGYAQPGYGYQGYSGNPAYSGPPGYRYPGYTGQPAYPSAGYGSPSNSGVPAYSGPPASAPPSDSGQPAYPGAPGNGYQSPPPYSPYSGSGYGSPVAGYPGDRPSEDW
jgi:hypothetical protein